MVTKATDPVLDLINNPVDGIVMEAATPLTGVPTGGGSGININNAPLIGLREPSGPNDAARLADVQANVLPAGIGPLPWAGSDTSVPSGWLLCDGTVYLIATYPGLYAAIGANYGGDNITTFAVPDLRGRVPVGKDDMGGAAAGRVPSATTEGDNGGAETHTLIIAEMPEHDHSGSTGSAGGHSHSGTTNTTGAHSHTYQRTVNGNGIESGGEYQNTSSSTSSTGNHSHTLTISSVSDHSHSLSINDTGGDGAHNNMQPYVVTNYIIKA